MDKDEQKNENFLSELLEWCKEQDCFLMEIEMKLHEMKHIAMYSQENDFRSDENAGLNGKLNQLKEENGFLD